MLAGKDKQERVEIDRNTVVDVKCRVEYLSFSAHTDAKVKKKKFSIFIFYSIILLKGNHDFNKYV